MKIPVLIFLISGIAASQLEPVASRIRHNAVEYATHSDSVRQLSGQLADAQLEMMGVLRSSHDSPEALQNHEAGLKYALRAEQIRLEEKEQCRQGAGVHC